MIKTNKFIFTLLGLPAICNAKNIAYSPVVEFQALRIEF